MALANYCAPADVQVYVPGIVLAEETAIWAILCGVSARAIDGYTDRYFFSDAGSTRYFDVAGDPSSSTILRSFQMAKHDFYGATTIKIAQIENGDPAVSTDWVQLTGDGITPPSDFYLEPANETYVGMTGDAHAKPFDRIEIPATPPRISTTFQAGFLPGKRTLSVTPPNWGWPAIPDEIKDIATKIVLRMWKSREAGWTGVVGSPEMGTAIVLKFLDINDLNTLNRYKKYTVG